MISFLFSRKGHETLNQSLEVTSFFEEPMEMTPPLSPSDSMMEVMTLTCINETETKETNFHIPEENVSFNSPRRDKPSVRIETQTHVPIPKNQTMTRLTTRRDNIPLPTVDHFSLDPELFHILLEISEGSGMLKSSDPVAMPSVYFKCRLFCLETPIRTNTFNETRDPKINFKQVSINFHLNNDHIDYILIKFPLLPSVNG